MSSSLAFRLSVGSSGDCSDSVGVPLENTPDWRLDMAGSWLTLGGLGLLSVEGGVGFGMGIEVRLRGFMPSGGTTSKGFDGLVGNCF